MVQHGDPDETAQPDDQRLLGRDVWWVAPIGIGGRSWGAIAVAADKGSPVPPDAARRIARCAEVCGLALASVEARRDLVGQLRKSEQLGEEVEALAAGRRFLLVEALRSEERMRRQIADALHDDVLQELYAARLDLDHAADDPEAAPRALAAVEAATRRVRDAVGDLHPAAASAHGLEDRLRSVLEQGGQRAGFGYRLTCDRASPSELDELVLALLREFVHNAVKHADATFLVVAVRDDDGDMVLEVRDDGRGMAPGRPAEALRAGHIGLASSRERVEAVGGSLELESAPGEGVSICVRLPRGMPGPAAPG
jgi:two-component system, NarL family, sensor kinase